LAKFRDTVAEFKGFTVAKSIAAASAQTGSARALRDKARALESEATRLRKQASTEHQKRVIAELGKVLSAADEKIDLMHAALLVALLENDELDVEAYRAEVERMARKLAAALPAKADDAAKVAALNKFLFAERGYHGSRSDYYHRSNSYLNEVIDDREGLPITL